MNSSQSPSNYLLHQHMHAVISLAEGLIKVRPTYPFGVDPVWHGSRSELPFLNSLKMKMSILLGVAQMNLGIILSYFNATYFKNSLNIWFQFIPQMIFLNSLFGYLSLLIIVKWSTGSQADLYHVMIYMFLSPTDDLCYYYWPLCLVPWMLLPKPFLLKKQHEARHQGESYTPLQSTEESLQLETNNDSHGHEEFEFSEVFVHQMIHTIEFVLGAVSNTASYLRLWALSLAHSELSSVFYEKVLLHCLGVPQYFYPCYWSHRLYFRDRRCVAGDGNSFSFCPSYMPYPASALGGIPKQILRGRWLPVLSLFICNGSFLEESCFMYVDGCYGKV
ncbi:hypothetical protein NC653_023524 [Populus alba x Populus x berolinensis]|uniref:V-type proton ATPase subunit a n=1 Tax=Populus alba x Populus x berolinensis TaxID=444605 RepID=A0AAD6MHN3_9ROSI|nr:hypothetical protein NC653_023524 [Populus alba x Populus x berolinensis]